MLSRRAYGGKKLVHLESERQKAIGRYCVKCGKPFVASDAGNIVDYCKGFGHFKCEKAKGKKNHDKEIK